METRSKREESSIREVLEFSNVEVVSSWLRLAKLIKAYELTDWGIAGKKARDLINDNCAVSYVEAIREERISMSDKPEPKKVEAEQEPPKEQPAKIEKTLTAPPSVIPPFELNNPTIIYELLIMLAPTLEERIMQKGKYWGVAKKRGYKDISLELTQKDRTGYYLNLVFYKNRVEDGAGIELHLHLDTSNQKIEPLAYKDDKETVDVYQDRYKRDMLKPAERKQQSDFLFKQLNRMLEIEYFFEHSKTPEEMLQIAEKKEMEEAKKFRENINNLIPDFEIGKVQLTEAHIRAGVDQRMINYINKEKIGIVLFPVRKVTNNTEDKRKDELRRALMPGFRISKTGKIYYEIRSNRSDLGNNGL